MENFKIKLVLLLAFGFALSCSSGKLESCAEIADSKSKPTLTSKNLEIDYYQDNELSYRFKTPLLERYMLVDSPYMDFRQGVHIETFDTLKNLTTVLDADYANYNEVAQLWEAKGNVVAKDSAGKTLLTEHLFWNEKKKKVYSNVTTKVVNGDEVTIGSGFESDDKLENIQFKKTMGRILMDTSKTVVKDTTLIDSTSSKGGAK